MNIKLILLILMLSVLPVYSYLYLKNDQRKGIRNIIIALIPIIAITTITFIISKILNIKLDNGSLIIGIIISLICNLLLTYDQLNLKKIPLGLLVILLYFLSSLLQLIPIKILQLFDINLDLKSITTSTFLTCYSDLIFIIILIVIYRKDLKRDLINLKKNFSNIFETSFKYWVLGFFGMVFSNIIIGLFFKNAVAGNENAVQEMIATTPLLTYICAGLLAPFIEEICFRKTFTDVIKNKWICSMISGLIFGLLHVIFSYTSLIDFIYIIPYSVLGFAFCLTVKETDNIFSSITMHMIHNSLIIMLSIMSGMIVL